MSCDKVITEEREVEDPVDQEPRRKCGDPSPATTATGSAS